MNLQQAGSPRSVANGYGCCKVEKETMKTTMSKLVAPAGVADSKGDSEFPSYDRLVYLTACLIGHSVEVQVKDGSVFSGIFHATIAEKDLGIILKMASEIKTVSSRGRNSFVNSNNKAPSKTFIIPYNDLVQMTAKDVSLTREDFEDDLQRVKQQKIMLDSFISQHQQVDLERELERWVPDKDDPQCPELDNIFDSPWTRPWDQFEANETLFGVKSTFDEDLYTTKLERGPQMRELEREATRIAREMEGEETRDLHLAEERGAQFPEHLDIDEETKYSSVFRGVDDSGYYEDDDEDILLNSQNIETFGDKLTIGKFSLGAQVPLCSFSAEVKQSSMASIAGDTPYFRHMTSQIHSDKSAKWSESRIQENQFSKQHADSSFAEEFGEEILLTEDAQKSKSKGVWPNYTSNPCTSQGSNKAQDIINSPNLQTENTATVKAQGATLSARTHERPSSSPNGSAISPSSSVGSLSSEKSTLNSFAKEFKLSPNAKSFLPSQSPLRPASPVTDSSYFPPNVPHMHGMPAGVAGPTYSPQPVIYNLQVSHMQSPQGYFHPNGPQYVQQMIIGHPQQVLYMPDDSPELQYREEIVRETPHNASHDRA